MVRVKRYLAYAIGEIILVVLGILIALQVNNWNEERKDQNRKQRYLQSLVVDLENDLYQLDSLVKSAIKDTTVLGRLRDRISSSETKIDTIIYIYRNELNPIITDAPRFKTSTFNSIEASGDIDLFSTEVMEKLSFLNKLQEEHVSFTFQDHSQYKRSINEMIKKYPSPMYRGSIQADSPMSKKIWGSIDPPDFISDLNGLIVVKYISNQLYLMRSDEIKKHTETLLKDFKAKVAED